MLFDLGGLHVLAQLRDIQADLLGHAQHGGLFRAAFQSHHRPVKLFVFVLLARCQGRFRGEHRSVSENGPFTIDEANVWIVFDQSPHLGFDPPTIGTVVVEKFHNSDVPFRVAENRRIRIVLDQIALVIQNLGLTELLRLRLPLFEDRHGLHDNLRVLADCLEH